VGWSVGLKPIAEDLMEVWLRGLLLRDRSFDEQFYSADIRPNKTADERKEV